MKSMKFIGCLYLLALLSACGSRTSDYDATGTFEATEVLVSAEASGKLLYFHVEEGTRLKAGEEVGLIDTLQLYLKKLQLQASMKSVESHLKKRFTHSSQLPGFGIFCQYSTTDRRNDVTLRQLVFYLCHLDCD